MNDIEKHVLRMIGESVTSPDVFTEANIAPIRDSINDGIAEMIMLNGGYRESYALPLVADKTFYRVTLGSGDFGWVESCWHTRTKRPLSQTDNLSLNREDPRWMVSRGTPQSYFPFGTDLLGFYPRPSASGDVVTIDMVVIPAPYETDTAPLRVRDQFRFALVSYAVSEYYAGRGDASRATDHYRDYAEAVNLRLQFRGASERLLQLTATKYAPEPPQVVSQ